jgi:hypothetical protein
MAVNDNERTAYKWKPVDSEEGNLIKLLQIVSIKTYKCFNSKVKMSFISELVSMNVFNKNSVFSNTCSSITVQCTSRALVLMHIH